MRRGLLASREELQALKGRVRHQPFDRLYHALEKRCSLILASAPVTETTWQALWEQGRWHAALEAARTTQGRLLDLAIAAHIDTHAAYRDRAIEELRQLIRWSTWVDPCHADRRVDLCTAEAAVAVVVGLDWLWEDLDESLRAEALAAVGTHVLAPYAEALAAAPWWLDCYHHWNAVINAGCGLAALALSDEDDLAADLHPRAAQALEPFFAALGQEGGWDEGVGYWGYALRYLLLFGHALSRLADDRRLLHARGMARTGAFAVYFTPNGRSASFGAAPTVPLYSALYLLPRYHPDHAEVMWWLDEYAFAHDALTSGWAAAGLGVLLRPETPSVAPPPALETLKVYQEIGWAAMADHWPNPSFYVAAKTGDLAANQSQRDMNSLQVQIDGEMLLIDPGDAPMLRAARNGSGGEVYQVQAVGHNTLTLGERDHRIDAQGRIAASGQAKDLRWLTCDAGIACGENARFHRHVVLLVDPKTGAGRMLVVLDEVAGAPQERVDVYWHTLGRVDLQTESLSGVIEGRRAGLVFALASTDDALVSVRQHEIDRTRTDRVIHLLTSAPGRALVASVFSREGLAGPLEIIPCDDGEVDLDLGQATLRFAPSTRHLVFQGVTYR